MKQETKELIEWIKNRLERTKWENSFAKNEGKDILNFDEDYDKAITFLDSLEVFENQLKHGSFLPDINNTPCKDGDLIKIVKPDRSGNHFPEFNEGDIYIELGFIHSQLFLYGYKYW